VAGVPRNAVRPANLRWELPIAATTGILIAEGDQPLARRIQGKSIEDVSRFWSNFGLGVEIASGGLAYVGGCARHRVYLRDTGLTIVDALAAAGTSGTEAGRSIGSFHIPMAARASSGEVVDRSLRGKQRAASRLLLQ